MSIQDDYLSIKEILFDNLYTSDIEIVRNEFKKLKPNPKKDILNLCTGILNQKSITRKSNEEIRVSIIKVLVAAYPDSLDQIETLLSKQYRSEQYEILFTLFCYADTLLTFQNFEDICSHILFFVRHFLLNVKRNTGNAAWMAGDLLGGHWKLQQSLPILFESLQKGNYVAGREAALNGLGEALKRTTNRNSRKRIIDLLEEIAKKDKSKHVRLTAKLIVRSATQTKFDL